MRKQIIEVEIEMNSITRKDAAEFFGTGQFENTTNRNTATAMILEN